MIDLECPFCKYEFEAEEWCSDLCPNCKAQYCWDEVYNNETGDCWEFIDWKRSSEDI